MADPSRVMLITRADRDAMVRAFNRVGSVRLSEREIAELPFSVAPVDHLVASRKSNG